MKLRFIGSDNDLVKNATYIPLNQLTGELDFWVDDVNGFQLDQVFLEELPPRRNGLPSHNYSYSYDGNMHIFPLFNSEDEDVALMLNINKLMVFPYTYIVPFDDDGKPTYDEDTTAILKLIIQHPEPAGIRVSFQQITTIHNNGIGANKEYDLNFSVYGIWTKEGLMEV